MTETKKSKHFTVISIIISVVFWIEETLIHRYVFGEKHLEIIPHETNELWMRLLTTILLIGFGIYADQRTNKLLNK